MNILPITFSVLPFLVFIFLLLKSKLSLFKSAVWFLIIYTLLAILYWKILPFWLFVSYGKGFFIAFDILIIIFGAIFFLQTLYKLDIIKNISFYLETLSKDYRVQVIILAWFFENFLEGTAGFGTPVAVVAPLLIGLGIEPIKALAISLLGNSASVVFGAAGTPIRVGFAGLNITGVPFYAALINCVGFIVPIFMLWIATNNRSDRKREFLDALPFAVWAGLAFVIPSLITVKLGQEFPSIIGSVIGLILVLATIKLKIFVPKEIKTLREKSDLEQSLSKFKSFLPYMLLITFLILGKIFFGNLSIPISLGFKHSFSIFNPGFAFILAAVATTLIWKKFDRDIMYSAKKAIKDSFEPFLVIVAMSTVVQIMTNSGQNFSGIPAAITFVAKIFETSLLPFFAPFIGAFGSFITGSATISNIMFGNFFNSASLSLGINTAIILALGVVGGAAGNMVALADMLTGEAVVGVKNQEPRIIKEVFIPCFIYLFLAAILGLIFIYFN